MLDGPHPRVDDPGAVGCALTVRVHGTNDFLLHLGEVGPALSADDVARVSTSSSGEDADRHGFIYARCLDDVMAARVVFDDDSDLVVTTTRSTTTGNRWVVWALHAAASPVRLDFLDHNDHVVQSQDVVDPRRHGDHTGTRPLNR